jgi:hypothetical protein
MTRREFLALAARGAAAGGLAVLAGRLLGVGRLLGLSRGPVKQVCVNEGVCRGCTVFADCGLPSALSARERAPWARGGAT